MECYSNEIENEMREYYNSLNEKDKRFFAGIEAKKLGHGGQTYISKILGCCRKTIYTSINDLKNLNSFKGIIRKSGGGRKPYYKTYPNIDSIFNNCIEKNTAGDPMNENLKWTDLTKNELVILINKEGINISEFVIRKLLKKHNFVKRKNQKKTH